jgi:predicted enzyme related to lactoylglutathione lyase
MYQGSNVTVMVSDMNRAVRFYTEALGLTLKARFGDGWAEVQAPGLTIGLHPVRQGAPTGAPAGGVSIGLQVENLEAAMATLKERGVEFRGIVEGEGVRLAHFQDPDGTPLYLGQATGS